MADSQRASRTPDRTILYPFRLIDSTGSGFYRLRKNGGKRAKLLKNLTQGLKAALILLSLRREKTGACQLAGAASAQRDQDAGASSSGRGREAARRASANTKAHCRKSISSLRIHSLPSQLQTRLFLLVFRAISRPPPWPSAFLPQ